MADKAKMRRLVYGGSADKVDMRQPLGYATTDASDEAMKFVFYKLGSREDPIAGERQAREGVEVTEDQAIQIMTSPYRVEGFYDVTDGQAPVYEGLADLPVMGVAGHIPPGFVPPAPPVELADQVARTAAQVRAAVKDQLAAIKDGEGQTPATPAATQPS